MANAGELYGVPMTDALWARHLADSDDAQAAHDDAFDSERTALAALHVEAQASGRRRWRPRRVCTAESRYCPHAPACPSPR